MNIQRRNFLLLGAVLFLSGCSKSIEMHMNAGLAPAVTGGVQASSKVQRVNFLLEPHETLGLNITDAVRRGEVSIYRGIFPEVLLGEYYPGRIRWNGMVRQADGNEFFAQFLFSPPDRDGNIMWTIIVDGHPDSTARLILVSTTVEFGYSPLGDEFPIENRSDFLKNKDGYRDKLILKKGSLLSDLRKVNTATFYREVLDKWNPWKSDAGDIWSPLGIKEVQEIAAINPQYSFSQKLVATGRFMLCADPIAITASAGIDFIRAHGAPSTGWDYSSELSSRRNAGILMAWIQEMRNR